MRPGIVVSSLVGILGRLSYRFEGVILIVMYNVTGSIDRAASPSSLSRTQGISTREMFN